MFYEAIEKIWCKNGGKYLQEVYQREFLAKRIQRNLETQK